MTTARLIRLNEVLPPTLGSAASNHGTGTGLALDGLAAEGNAAVRKRALENLHLAPIGIRDRYNRQIVLKRMRYCRRLRLPRHRLRELIPVRLFMFLFRR